MLIGIVGLAIDGWVIFPAMMTVTETNEVARSFPDVFVYFWTYFTHLTNLGLVLVYLSELTGWRGLGWFRQRLQPAGAWRCRGSRPDRADRGGQVRDGHKVVQLNV